RKDGRFKVAVITPTECISNHNTCTKINFPKAGNKTHMDFEKIVDREPSARKHVISLQPFLLRKDLPFLDPRARSRLCVQSSKITVGDNRIGLTTRPEAGIAFTCALTL